MMGKKIQVLDCTLRDGGLGLEDAYKNGVADVKFDYNHRRQIADALTKAKIDIIELGSIEITEDDRTGYAIYPSIEAISKEIPEAHSDDTLYAALYRGPDTPIEDIPEWREGLCEVVRVIIRYSELRKSLYFCSALSEKGYKVFVQPMLTMRYTDEEIDLLIQESNRMKAYALYFVDSYGYMMDRDVERFVKRLHNGLDKNICIGFHAHNNMNLAFSNVLSFFRQNIDRTIIIDTCVLGMGQGAGNLQSELLIGYLATDDIQSRYRMEYLLDACEIVEEYCGDSLWGYSVTRLLPALNKTAYKYAIVLRKKYHMTYRDIYTVLQNIPEQLRQRYTMENLMDVLKNLEIHDNIIE